MIIRPADANECSQAWHIAVEQDGPVGLVLSRQPLEVLPGTSDPLDNQTLNSEGVIRGAYILADSEGTPDIVLIGTGSEVALCLHTRDTLKKAGRDARVVSFPSWELFDGQDEDYRKHVLPPGVPVLAVEAASKLGWERYADRVIGMESFGASAPGAQVMEKFGFTVDNVTAEALSLLEVGPRNGRN